MEKSYECSRAPISCGTRRKPRCGIGHPVYDCLYIACAKLTGSILVTADRKLGETVADRVPDVEAVTLQDTPAMAKVEAGRPNPFPEIPMVEQVAG